MANFLSPIGNSQFVDVNGNPLTGGKVYTYLADSSTPAATFTSFTGAIQQANPIILNSLGLPTDPIWLLGGTTYKFVIKDYTDVTMDTVDNISGVNDNTAATIDEWITSGFLPTYVAPTVFSVVGDKTAFLTVGRRIKTTNTAGTIYSYISTSVFSAGITTVTVVNDAGALDVGLSLLFYSFLSSIYSSLPNSGESRLSLGLFMQSVKNAKFGAKGDGVTDDTAAIQACADSIRLAGGGIMDVPRGTYIITQSIALGANTTLRGEGGASVIKAKQVGFLGTLAASNCYLIKNYNWSAATITDTNIFIENMAFDYGTVTLVGGGLHAVSMRRVKTVKVSNCIFSKGENATAMLGCNDTHVDSCYATGFSNCAWDHWTSPKNARVTNCYAETTLTVQMCNFNPENTSGSSAGNVADGFLLSGCQFFYTPTGAAPCQIEPLAAGTSVKNVTISGNFFNNTYLSMRGAVTDSMVCGNIFTNLSGNKNAFVCAPLYGGTPANIGFQHNNISGATTALADFGVIRMQANGYNVEGNIVSGTSFYVALYVDVYVGVVGNNSFSTGTSGKQITGTGWQPVGTAVTFTNLWVDFGGAYKPTSYWKGQDNIIHLCIAMKTGTFNVAAFTLPAGFRPLNDLVFPSMSNSAFGTFQISATGAVTPTVGSAVNFFNSEVTFLAAN